MRDTKKSTFPKVTGHAPLKYIQRNWHAPLHVDTWGWKLSGGILFVVHVVGACCTEVHC